MDDGIINTVHCETKKHLIDDKDAAEVGHDMNINSIFASPTINAICTIIDIFLKITLTSNMSIIILLND